MATPTPLILNTVTGKSSQGLATTDANGNITVNLDMQSGEVLLLDGSFADYNILQVGGKLILQSADGSLTIEIDNAFVEGTANSDKPPKLFFQDGSVYQPATINDQQVNNNNLANLTDLQTLNYSSQEVANYFGAVFTNVSSISGTTSTNITISQSQTAIGTEAFTVTFKPVDPNQLTTTTNTTLPTVSLPPAIIDLFAEDIVIQSPGTFFHVISSQFIVNKITEFIDNSTINLTNFAWRNDGQMNGFPVPADPTFLVAGDSAFLFLGLNEGFDSGPIETDVYDYTIEDAGDFYTGVDSATATITFEQTQYKTPRVAESNGISFLGGDETISSEGTIKDNYVYDGRQDSPIGDKVVLSSDSFSPYRPINYNGGVNSLWLQAQNVNDLWGPAGSNNSGVDNWANLIDDTSRIFGSESLSNISTVNSFANDPLFIRNATPNSKSALRFANNDDHMVLSTAPIFKLGNDINFNFAIAWKASSLQNGVLFQQGDHATAGVALSIQIRNDGTYDLVIGDNSAALNETQIGQYTAGEWEVTAVRLVNNTMSSLESIIPGAPPPADSYNMLQTNNQVAVASTNNLTTADNATFIGDFSGEIAEMALFLNDDWDGISRMDYTNQLYYMLATKYNVGLSAITEEPLVGNDNDAVLMNPNADLFMFHENTTGSEVIKDFTRSASGNDKIALNFDFNIQLSATPNSLSGTGVANELAWNNDGTDSTVELDYDGDGTADFSILVENVTDLTLADFQFNRVVGTSGSETIYGYDAVTAFFDDSIYIENYLDGRGGADTIIGGMREDTIIYDILDVLQDGGDYYDTLMIDRYTAASNNIVLSSVVDTKLDNFEIFDITGNGDNILTLDQESLARMSDVTNGFEIVGNTGDVVNLVGDGSGQKWTQVIGEVYSAMLGGKGFNAYSSPNTEIVVFVQGIDSNDINIL